MSLRYQLIELLGLIVVLAMVLTAIGYAAYAFRVNWLLPTTVSLIVTAIIVINGCFIHEGIRNPRTPRSVAGHATVIIGASLLPLPFFWPSTVPFAVFVAGWLVILLGSFVGKE